MFDIKISVAIITYNQEKLIERTLNSLLLQKEWLFEIIICDDCSTDDNWKIILKYANQYPSLIRAFKNEKNLGLFSNWESTWEKVNGNLMYLMAGDDTVNVNLFKNVHEIVIKNKIDCNRESISIYFDFETVYQNGQKTIHSNKKLKKGFDPVSLKLRGLIWNRTIFVSRKVFEKFQPVNKSIGIYADALLDIQIPLYTDKFFYMPYIGNVYYYGIGIASRTKKEEHWRSIILSLKELEKKYQFSKTDKNWIQYKISFFTFHLNPNFRNLIDVWLFYIISRNISYGVDLKNPLRLLKLTSKIF